MNPIMKSLWDITSQDIATDLMVCYDLSKSELGPNFDRVMATINNDIEAIRLKMKPGTHFAVAGLFMAQPEEDDDDLDIDCRRYIKAAIAWRMFRDGIKSGEK